MSTQLFLVRVPKENIFEFSKLLRDEVLKDITPELKSKNAQNAKYMEFMRKHKDEFCTDVQLFELMPESQFYYVRILENGWQLRNLCSKMLASDIVFVDDRAMSEDEIIEANKPNGIEKDFLLKIPEVVDELIRHRKYFIVPIVSAEDYLF